MEKQLSALAPNASTAYTPSPQRSWQDQPLPAPLISYDQAELVALGLLRQQSSSSALVGISQVRVLETLRTAGVSTSALLFSGRDQLQPDLVLQTSPEDAARFDVLHAQVLCAPQSLDPDAAGWLRQRRLAHLRLLALGGEDATVLLPDVDALWQPPTYPAEPTPSMARWVLQALPLLAVGGVAMVVYIYNAGPGPDLWPLFALPLAGALAFGALLFHRLSSYRRTIAALWLARPARLRPETLPTARQLARRPWQLLYLPALLVLAAFVTLFLLLVADVPILTTVSMMVWPFIGFTALLLGLTYATGRRYLKRTQALVQHLPQALVPDQLGFLWQSYLYY